MMKRANHGWHLLGVHDGVDITVCGGEGLLQLDKMVFTVVVVETTVTLDVKVTGGTVIGQEDVDPEEAGGDGHRVQVPHGFVLTLPLMLPLPLEDEKLVGHEIVVVDTNRHESGQLVDMQLWVVVMYDVTGGIMTGKVVVVVDTEHEDGVG
jgi:hypothetical protein